MLKKREKEKNNTEQITETQNYLNDKEKLNQKKIKRKIKFIC